MFKKIKKFTEDKIAFCFRGVFTRSFCKQRAIRLLWL